MDDYDYSYEEERVKRNREKEQLWVNEMEHKEYSIPMLLSGITPIEAEIAYERVLNIRSKFEKHIEMLESRMDPMTRLHMKNIAEDIRVVKRKRLS